MSQPPMPPTMNTIPGACDSSAGGGEGLGAMMTPVGAVPIAVSTRHTPNRPRVTLMEPTSAAVQGNRRSALRLQSQIRVADGDDMLMRAAGARREDWARPISAY